MTVTFTRSGPIGIAVVDNPPVNLINHAVRVGLADALVQARSQPAVQAMLILSTGRMFMAGVDITEFSGARAGPSLQELQETIETAPFPVVVAIQGLALGGGLELAMSCHYRIATVDAKLGLPEITLGLIPGAGGTQRLPRLVGARRALDMMLSGAPITAREGLAWGLIDEIATEDLRESATKRCASLIGGAQGPRVTRDLPVRDALDDRAVAEALSRNARTIKGLTAPSLLIQCIKAASLPFDQGTTVEKKLADESLELRESRALRYLFFAERSAGKPLASPGMGEAPRIGTAAVVGAGTMGSAIALAFADAGIPVRMIDNAATALERGMKTIAANYAASVQKGRLDRSTADQRMALITASTDLENAGGCDVVIEAVFEDMSVKRAVLASLDAVVSADRLIASNTSTLSITDLARATAHPERVVGLHFFSPAHIMKLLEIVRSKDTAPRILAMALQVSRQLKKIGVVAGDGFGFIGNRMMLDGYWREAEQLMLEGASPIEVDSAMEEFGFAMGPQKVSDLGGTDVGTKARCELYKKQSRADPYFAIADQLTAMGRLGQKTGAGFYRYEAGERTALPDPEVTAVIEKLALDRHIVRRAIARAEIAERCVLSLILVGARVLEEGTAARASDIDVVWTNGYGFPRRLGGPMFYADGVGLTHVAARIRYYHDRCGDYWCPSPLLETLAAQGSTFETWDARSTVAAVD